jgi:hypothetical protein
VGNLAQSPTRREAPCGRPVNRQRLGNLGLVFIKGPDNDQPDRPAIGSKIVLSSAPDFGTRQLARQDGQFRRTAISPVPKRTRPLSTKAPWSIRLAHVLRAPPAGVCPKHSSVKAARRAALPVVARYHPHISAA